MPTINNWTYRTTSPYTPPEASRIEISGEAFGHPSFPDGGIVATSPVRLTVEGFESASGRSWRLGNPSPHSGQTLAGFQDTFLEIAYGRLKAGFPLGNPPEDSF